MKQLFTQLNSEDMKSDLVSGFLVFLIALPLCLGISMASGFPPIAGIFTAIIGGLFVGLVGGSQLTIKGPAAGLIVIAFGSVQELGGGDLLLGYQLTLGVIVVSGILQILMGMVKSGKIATYFPPTVVHGMMSAIGIIIIIKQSFTLVGVKSESKDLLHAIQEIPIAMTNLNPDIFFIGVVSLVLLILLPNIPNQKIKKIPAPLVVVLISIPLGLYFDLNHEHTYLFLDSHQYSLGPKYLVTLPENFFSAIQFPDFSKVFTTLGLKYIILFAVIGSLESLLSVKAIDAIDPLKRSTSMNRDLVGIGLGNTVSGLIGGLPMISEIVRSSANVNNGGRTWKANFFHGVFLFIFVAFFPFVIHQIPLTALAAMLIYTGFRLASPSSFYHVYKHGKGYFIVFIATILITIVEDLLVGIAVGSFLNLLFYYLRKRLKLNKNTVE